ncbi:MAG: hypothetical protein KTR31_37680, partial [Myxococcales bacterium]|nr:hypothetical protein [Myxococcales bacterium]
MADGDPHTPPGHRLTERLTERRRSRPMALDSAFTLVDRLAERLLALGDADEAFLDEGVGLTYLTYPTDPEELRWTETGRRPTSDRVASRPWSSPQPRVRTPMSALRTPPRAARAARTAPPTTVVQPPPDSAAAIDASAPSRSRSPSVRTPPRSRSEASPPTAAADRAFQGAPRATTLAASSRAATESRSAPARPWASAHRTGGSRVPRPGPAERILRDVAARTRGSQRAVARTAA